MFNRKATVSALFVSPPLPIMELNAPVRTWLPVATKMVIAANVAHVVIRWLLARCTALLVRLVTVASTGVHSCRLPSYVRPR